MTWGFDWSSGYFPPFQAKHSDTTRELDTRRRAWIQVASLNNKYTKFLEGLVCCEIDADQGDEKAQHLMAVYRQEYDQLVAQQVARRLERKT